MKSQMKPHLGSEIRGAYEELIAIAEDASSDADKTKAIQDFAEQIAGQMKAGFSSGFSSGGDDGEESKDAKFLRIKKQIKLLGIKEVPSQYSSRQGVLFSVKNESEFPVKSIKVNFDYYRAGELIDTKNEWLNEIEVLDAGESINLKKDRSLPNGLSEPEKIAFTFDEVKASITSFRIVEK
jgi:hypothetical protein